MDIKKKPVLRNSEMKQKIELIPQRKENYFVIQRILF